MRNGYEFDKKDTLTVTVELLAEIIAHQAITTSMLINCLSVGCSEEQKAEMEKQTATDVLVAKEETLTKLYELFGKTPDVL